MESCVLRSQVVCSSCEGKGKKSVVFVSAGLLKFDSQSPSIILHVDLPSSRQCSLSSRLSSFYLLPWQREMPTTRSLSLLASLLALVAAARDAAFAPPPQSQSQRWLHSHRTRRRRRRRREEWEGHSPRLTRRIIRRRRRRLAGASCADPPHRPPPPHSGSGPMESSSIRPTPSPPSHPSAIRSARDNRRSPTAARTSPRSAVPRTSSIRRYRRR